ncbi:hypothetical protein MKY88_03475 [Lysinibacillus sp. FSL R7-0073]|uniref:hypothetical protein n=1 Tax=Lysinibacillus TaxID=400634 RepID=UPI002E1CC5F1|nr:hypothetical protein [Lysinibacillus fusiformis]
MEKKEALFIFTKKTSSKLKAVKNLKKGFKENNIKFHEIVDIKRNINILTLQQELEDQGINVLNIDLITDNLELLICSFRIYNNHFRNFIYLFNYEKSNEEREAILVHKDLFEFKGIESEKINKKIYVNLNSENYIDLMGEMIPYLDYISFIGNYKTEDFFDNEKISNKLYWLNEKDNIFIDFEKEQTQEIYLYENRINEFERLGKYKFESDIEIASYYALHIINKNEIENFVKTMKELQGTFNDVGFKQFLLNFIELLDEKISNAEVKTVIYQLLFDYSSDFHEIIYRKIMHYIYSGKLNWDKWKSLIIMFYAFNFGGKLKLSDDVYKTTKEVNISIGEIIEKNLNLPKTVKLESDSKKVVILIDQLLSLKHSPTHVLKVIVEMLLNKSDYEYHIIVEENMILSREEYVLRMISYLGNESTHAIEIFKQLIDEDRVKIHLANKELSIIPRVQWIVEKVFEIKPQLVFSLSYYSTAQNILYNYYPVLNFSFGHEYLPAKAHLYLYKNEQRAKTLAEQFKDSVNIDYYIQPPIIIPRTTTYKREEFGYRSDDYIIITSGNRIEKEIDNALIDEMKVVLKENRNFKWLLVGSNIPPYMLKTFDETMMLQQVKHIPYAEDLIAINEICDISINPNRIGGGYCVASCLGVGVPVLMCKFESDGLVFIGEENSIDGNYSDLVKQLIYLSNQPKERKELADRQFQITKQISNVEDSEKLLEYFDETKRIFLRK